jgi:hypothetical protein
VQAGIEVDGGSLGSPLTGSHTLESNVMAS